MEWNQAGSYRLLTVLLCAASCFAMPCRLCIEKCGFKCRLAAHAFPYAQRHLHQFCLLKTAAGDDCHFCITLDPSDPNPKQTLHNRFNAHVRTGIHQNTAATGYRCPKCQQSVINTSNPHCSRKVQVNGRTKYCMAVLGQPCPVCANLIRLEHASCLACRFPAPSSAWSPEFLIRLGRLVEARFAWNSLPADLDDSPWQRFQAIRLNSIQTTPEETLRQQAGQTNESIRQLKEQLREGFTFAL